MTTLGWVLLSSAMSFIAGYRIAEAVLMHGMTEKIKSGKLVIINEGKVITRPTKTSTAGECSQCDGHGDYFTGIKESPLAKCEKCYGTGKGFK